MGRHRRAITTIISRRRTTITTIIITPFSSPITETVIGCYNS
jgi:hypothetical protein